MNVTQEQLDSYLRNGFLLIEDVFKQNEVNIILDAINVAVNDHKISKINLEGLVLEEDKKSIRTINGLHLKCNFFQKLCANPRLLPIAQKLVSDKNLYMHQFKVNFKQAFTGDIWDWHQDYIYWLNGDGMPQPRAISVSIFLDDVTEFNGPLMFIPGSHKFGIVEVEEELVIKYQPSWLNNVTANLKYKTSRKVIEKFTKKFGILAPKAQRGSILFFDSNIIHASTSNLSPFDRRFVLITYNPVDNVSCNFSNPRPDFLASRDFTAISLVEDDLLLSLE